MPVNKNLAFELQNVFGQMRRAGLIHQNQSKLKGAEKYILFLIYDLRANQPATISEIANKMGVTLAAVTHQIKTLEKNGLVRRDPHLKDRRVFIIKLTKKGRGQIEKIKKEFTKKAQILAEFLGEEDTRDLIRLVKKMSAFKRSAK